MLQYANEVRHIALKTLTCHDVISQMYTRKKENGGLLSPVYQYQEQRTLSLEKRNLRLFNTVFAMNPKDKELLLKIDRNLNVQVLAPYFHQPKQIRKNTEKKFDLAFFGAMNRKENEDAVLWFMDKIYPGIQEKFPNLKFAVIGNRPSNDVLELGEKYPNVTVTGFVEDPYELIRSTSIGIIPLRLGAGIKIKTLEILACGIPVVSTTVGAEGISATENSGLFIEDTISDFKNRILDLLNDPIKTQNLGEQAKIFIKENYDLSKNVEIIEATYQ